LKSFPTISSPFSALPGIRRSAFQQTAICLARFSVYTAWRCNQDGANLSGKAAIRHGVAADNNSECCGVSFRTHRRELKKPKVMMRIVTYRGHGAAQLRSAQLRPTLPSLNGDLIRNQNTKVRVTPP
jgi:hypothetical protein